MHEFLSRLLSAGPQWVVLLVGLPLIGAGLVAAVGRRHPELAWQVTQSNRWLTVAVSLLVAAVWLSRSSAEPSTSLSAVLPWFAIERTDGRESGRLFAACVWSLGIDVLSLAPLMTIPWLAALTGRPRKSAAVTELVSDLLLEFALLLTFAAYDATTFLTGSLLSFALVGLQLGWSGRGDRRAAAVRFWRTEFTAHVLWSLGLTGVAVAAAWSRQEMLARIPPVDFRWIMLSRGLPQIVKQSEAGFYYWAAAAPLLFALLLTGVLLRGPWTPLQRGLASLLASLPRTSLPLVMGSWPLLAGYGWLQFVMPAFGTDVAAVGTALAWWAALSATLASRRCWIAPDLKSFAAGWQASLQSLGWLGLVSGAPAGLSGGWLMLLASGWSTAVWHELGEGSVGRRGAVAFAGLTIVPLVTIPVWGGPADAASPLRTVLVMFLEPTGLALAAWFVTGWAAVRRVARLLVRARSPDSMSDRTESNPLVLALLGACLVVIVLRPHLWWGLR